MGMSKILVLSYYIAINILIQNQNKRIFTLNVVCCRS